MKFSVKKTSSDKGLPVPKKDLTLIYVDDVFAMPKTSERGIVANTEFFLKNNSRSYELYLTPATQKLSADIEGDLPVKGWKPVISGNFPGTKLEITEWMHNNILSGFIALQKVCPNSNSFKVFGDVYNPLFLTGKISEDKESSFCEITLTCSKKCKRPYMLYNFPIEHFARPGDFNSDFNSDFFLKHYE